MFNEIWQIRDYENINIEGFKIAKINQRENRKGGGVIIYIRESLKYTNIDSPFMEGVIETAATKINGNIFVSLYRPPSGSKNDFITHLTSWIDSITGSKIYIAGDFNINYLNNEKEYYEKIEQENVE